jgi:Cupin-like domain
LDLTVVPRRSASEFQPLRNPGTPCVITDLARSWPAIRDWEPQYLKKIAAGTMVDVRERRGAPRNIYQNMATGGSIALADYIDWVMEMAGSQDLQTISKASQSATEVTRAIDQARFDRSYYLDVDLARLPPQLLSDVSAPPWYGRPPLRTLLWMGVLGTSSGLHADVTPNCNVQVVGRKSFALFAPNQTRFLYRMRRSTHCAFDPNEPDYAHYPLAQRSSGMLCVLSPGEALYIPVGWYHQVTVVSPWAVNVNFFWPRPFPQGLLTRPLWSILLRRVWARYLVRMKRYFVESRLRPFGLQ